jgi:hypothetical protein
MKIRITVGEVDVRLDGLDLTHRQVRGLLKYAVGAATALTVIGGESETETESKAPIGFAATIERLPEEIPADDLSWYFDEE